MGHGLLVMRRTTGNFWPDQGDISEGRRSPAWGKGGTGTGTPRVLLRTRSVDAHTEVDLEIAPDPHVRGQAHHFGDEVAMEPLQLVRWEGR